MGQQVATPSFGPISALDIFRCMCQNPNAIPSGQYASVLLMNAYPRRLIPTDNVWVTNNAQMGMDSYRNRRGLLTVYTVGYKVASGTNLYGWSVRSGHIANPLGTGPASGYTFALTTTGNARHLNIQTAVLSMYGSTTASYRIEVQGSDLTSWGVATISVYAGGTWYTMTSGNPAYSPTPNITYWDTNVLGWTALITALQQTGTKIYLCVTFANS